MYGARPMRSVHRLQNLTQGHRWWSISNKKTATGATSVSIYDEIGFYGVTAKGFVDDLKNVDGDLDIHVNSPGGDVFDAIAIYNTLKNRSGIVAITIDGAAFSAASFIAQAASPGHLVMGQSSRMMIHDGFAQGIGNAADMRKLANELDAASDSIAAIYATRTGKPVAYWRDKMKDETWYSPEEAVADGLADRVEGDGMRNNWDLTVYNKKSKAGKKGKKPAFLDDGDPGKDSDQDGDDDTTPEGDTDHDVFPVKKGKKAKKAGKPMNADGVDESPWDASKAMAAGSRADNPAAFFRAICAGEKTTGDPSTQAHWALPYRYTPDSAPNAAAVRNAMARLSQTQDLKDPAAVRTKLEGLMKKVNPDYEPGNHIDTRVLATALGNTLKGVKNG